MTDDKQRDLQNLLMQIENGRRQLESLNRQIQLLDNAMAELGLTTMTMDALGENTVGAEILVPIGGDSFVRAEIKDNERVMVGVGAGLSVEKTIPDAKKILENRAKAYAETLEKLRKTAVGIGNEIDGLSQNAEELVQELKG